MEEKETHSSAPNDFFKPKEFDPTIYQKYIDALSAGKTINFINKRKHPGYKTLDYRELNKDLDRCAVICSSVEEFDGEVYDIFILNIEPQHQNFIWGIGGCKNPVKETLHIYIDGIIFPLCKHEYLEVLKYYNPARILSLASHYIGLDGGVDDCGSLKLIV